VKDTTKDFFVKEKIVRFQYYILLIISPLILISYD
jgi:hypothetical protein